MREKASIDRRIPPGPTEKYSAKRNLLSWMGEQFGRYGDIYRASVYGANVYATRDPNHAQHVLRANWQNYTKGQAIKRVALLLGNGLMVSEGEFWKTQRRMVQPAFHRQAIAGLVDVMSKANVELLRKWEDAARKQLAVNVTRDVSAMVLEVVLASIFGHDYGQAAPQFSILSEESTRNLGFAQSFRALGKIVVQVAANRRKQESAHADILGMLMESRDGNGEAMSDRQLVNEIRTLIVAGHETTASTLAWTWYLLSRHPEVEAKLSRELADLDSDEPAGIETLPKFAYARQILDEVMRLYPAGWLMTRRALKDDVLGEYFVPAGAEIYVAPYFIQRNPSLWEEAEHFDPDRFATARVQGRHPMATIPFSAGPRNCIGEVFARVEMQLHLMTIAKTMRLKMVETKPPELDIGVNLRSKSDFIMVPELRVPMGA